MLTLYGIAHCDTIRKARLWLQDNGVRYLFHDYKHSGIDAGKLNYWISKTSIDSIFNKRSTTWKQLKEEFPTLSQDKNNLIRLMTEHTSIIRRPIIEINNEILVGYDESAYIEKILNTK